MRILDVTGSLAGLQALNLNLNLPPCAVLPLSVIAIVRPDMANHGDSYCAVRARERHKNRYMFDVCVDESCLVGQLA